MNRYHYWLGSALIAIGGFTAWTSAQTPNNPPSAERPVGDPSEADAREKAIADRFQKVLDTNPRRGTALDRLYGYHVERGTLEKLLQIYADRIGADAGDGKAWLVTGLLEAQRGKDALAVAAYRKAEELLPENAIAPYYLGQSFVLIGQPDEAAKAFERAIARKPNRNDQLEIFQALGRIYQRSQRTEQALGTWNRLEKLYPDDARVQEQIATTLVEEGQFAQALPRLVKLAAATEDKYRQSTFLMDVADLKVKLKKTPEALADFEKLLSDLNPESWLYRDVRRRIEEVFLRNDDSAGLAKYYEKWLEKNPTDVEAVARLAKNLVAQGRAADARGWLEKGIAAAPGNKSLRQALIDQYAAEQNFTAAAAQYELLAKNDPGNPDTLRDWGRLLMRDAAKPEADRKAAAAAVWKKILEKKPTDPVLTSQVADLLRGANIPEEAVALYRKAVELAPNAAQYREYLGEYYHSLKKSEEALATWRPIAEGANRNSKNLNRLAEVFAGFGYRREAIEAMGEAIKLEGNDFSMRMVMAEFLHTDSRNDDALKEIDEAVKLVSNPEESEAVLLAQIKIYRATEKLGERIDALQKEIDGGRDATAERLLRLARFYESNRQPEKATETIAGAAVRDPKSVPVLVAAARMHEAGGNFLAASETNERLASLDRRYRSEYLQAVAKLEQRLGRRDRAMQAGRDLLASSPGNPEVYKFFAELCFQSGDVEEGFESLRRSVRANPSDPAGLVTLANALVERFRQGEAIELFWRAFEKTTELEARLGLIDRLAGLYLENNQFDKLIERLERERQEAEKAREFTMCIAQAYQAAGDLGTARLQLERLLTENTRDAGLLGQLVQLCETEGDTGLALKYQRQLVAAAPSNSDHQLKLAQLLTRTGGADEAAEIWVKLVAAETEPHRNLAAIDRLIDANKHDSALAILTRMSAQKPGNWELVYREGAVLMALGKKAEAAARFQSILSTKQQDDDLGEQAKNNLAQTRKKAKLNPKAAAMASVNTALSNYDDSSYPPLSRRLGNVSQIRQAVGLDVERYYGNQQRVWTPSDFGEARMACLGWMHEAARDKGEQAAHMKSLRAAKDQPNADARALWDYFYLLSLRGDRRDLVETTLLLSKGTDPAGALAYLNSLVGRQNESRFVSVRGRDSREDKTPPLPPEQLTHALECFNKLRQARPEWANGEITKAILGELKRARRDDDAGAIYKAFLQDTGTVPRVQAAMALALDRDDFETVLKLYDQLEKLQGPVPVASKLAQLPTRQSNQTLITVMGKSMDAKKYDDARRVMDRYLTMTRRQNLAAPRAASSVSTRAAGSSYVYLYAGKSNRGNNYKELPFPTPNEYYDLSSIQMLYCAFDLHQKADLVSDLQDHFRKLAEAAAGVEKLYAHLALGYLHWWMEEKDEALAQLTLATQAVPNDHTLILEVAALREQNDEFAEALRLLDTIAPLDHQMMVMREDAAMRLAERTGNVDRARQSANRLFGMRLDSDRQLDLAGRMHRLGMHELAETVLGRAQRQAGGKSATLQRLMMQYQSQNNPEMAVQIARQILRKPPSTSAPNPRGSDEAQPGRVQAVGVLARSGQLKEMIGRAEAQLKASPNSVQIHQTLLEYYRAANDREKQKTTVLRIVELKPEDAKLRYSMAQQLQGLGDEKNAMIHYREAIKRDPILLQNNYWQIEQLFTNGGKYEELGKLLDEIDLRKVGQPYYIGNMISGMMQGEGSRQMAMKLFRKAWDAFPGSRAELLRYVGEGPMTALPEIYDYMRQAVIPRDDSEGDPWSLAVNVTGYESEGRSRTAFGQMLGIARKQHRLPELRAEVAGQLAKKPDWVAGEALLAIVDIQLGRKEQGLKAYEEIFEKHKGKIPPMARFVLTQELEYYAGAEKVAVRTLEGGIDELMDGEDYNGNDDFEYSPVRRLVWWYRQLERPEEARDLVRRYARVERVDPGYGGGYWQYRQVNGKMSIARCMVSLGDPVEAIRLYGSLLAKPEDVATANAYSGGGRMQFDQQIENGMKQAIEALTPETLSAAMAVLLKPRTEKGQPALDLVLAIESRELSRARITSVLATALKAAAATDALAKESREKLAQLAGKFPNDPSVRIAAAYAAFLGEDEKARTAAVEGLLKLLEGAPLEALQASGKANSRQREEARPQIGLWLVARECLAKGRDTHVDAGRKIGERALAAARRQNETVLAQAILREWGQLEFDRGDPAKCEEKWAEMLELLLPKPAVKKVAASPVPSALAVPTPPVPAGPAPEGDDGEENVTSISFNRARSAAPVPVAPSSSTAVGPVLTMDGFQPIFEYARTAADRKLGALSVKSMKEALKAGPPAPGKQNERGGNSFSSTTINGVQYYVRQDGKDQQMSPDAALAVLVPMWRKIGVPPADIYEVLALAVLPDTRPAEVFLSSANQMAGRYYTLSASGSLTPAAVDPVEPGSTKDLSKLLIRAAIAAKKTDDLAKKAESRLAQPLGELPAKVLLFNLALEMKDEARAAERLAALGDRLKKDTLATTIAHVSAAATAALERPALEAAAEAILAGVSAAYAASNNIGEAVNTSSRLMDHRLGKKDREGARKLLEAARELANKTNSNDPGLRNRLGGLFLKAGFVEEALAEYAYALDARSAGGEPDRAAGRADPVGDSVPSVVKALLELPAEKRYAILKAWTLPTSGRKSIRYFVGPLPKVLPPPEFAELPPWPRATTVSTMSLLIDAAREAGKLDELTAAADRTAKDGVENAATFRLLVYLSQSKGRAVEADAKAFLEAAFKRLTYKPKEPVGGSRFRGGEERGIPFRHSEFRIAELASREPGLASAAEKLLPPMLEKATNDADAAKDVQTLQNRIALEKLAAPDALKEWLPAGWVDPSSPASVWFAQDGLLLNARQSGNAHLMLGVPLTGTFEFSVDIANGGRGSGAVGFGGLTLLPNKSAIISTLGGERNPPIARETAGVRTEQFNTLTVKASPKKLEMLVNGKPWYEDADPAPTSPWLMLHGDDGGRPVYRNFKLSGKPETPSEVKLVAGDYIDGWRSLYTASNVPVRIALREEEEIRRKGVDRFGRGIVADRPEGPDGGKPVYDWTAKEGELRGRRLDAPSETAIPSHLGYHRPLLSGENVSCEFFHKTGESHVHPALGRLVFLLEPEGVQWFWLGSDDDNWLNIRNDRGIPAPASYAKTVGKLPLKDDDWNALKLGITDGKLRIELNGAVIHAGPIPEGVERTFGLFHWRNRAEARVRKIALTGPWAKSVGEIGFATEAVGPQIAHARRELVGERNYSHAAEGLLAAAKDLPPAERLRRFADWVLPNADRPVFQLGGVLTPRNAIGVVNAKEQPAGRRVMLPSRFESPVLELVALAKEAGTLGELKRKVSAFDPTKAGAASGRARTALLASIHMAEGNDAEAKAGLLELKAAAEAMPPSAPGNERWPMLLAVHGAFERPALARPAYDLAQALNANVEKAVTDDVPFDDRDWWFRNIRFARARLSATLNEGTAVRAFGDNTVFRHWTAASGVGSTSRNIAANVPHWRFRDGTLVHEPGCDDDYLILNTPLRGDFTVSATLRLKGWREASVRYGGVEVRLDDDRKSFKLVRQVGEEGTRMMISPPLREQVSDTYAFKLVVAGGRMKFLIDGQQIHEETVGPLADPWLLVRCTVLNTGELKDFALTGAPTVPETIDLTAGDDFPMWRNYYSNNNPWTKRGEEMFHPGGKGNIDVNDQEGGRYQSRVDGFPESAFYYQRPMAEDGVVEYDFYYSPDKALVHPVLDRLAFLLEPDGVKLHLLTDAQHEKSSLAATNAVDEPANRRGTGKLPLKPKEWNRVKLSLAGDTLKLYLNGIEIYERAIEPTNQRLFGLFHFKDKTEARVRSMTYTGKWPKQVPGTLFETGK